MCLTLRLPFPGLASTDQMSREEKDLVTQKKMMFGTYRALAGGVELGRGSCKVVYEAENVQTRMRVAWSQIGVAERR